MEEEKKIMSQKLMQAKQTALAMNSENSCLKPGIVDRFEQLQHTVTAQKEDFNRLSIQFS